MGVQGVLDSISPHRVPLPLTVLPFKSTPSTLSSLSAVYTYAHITAHGEQ